MVLDTLQEPETIFRRHKILKLRKTPMFDPCQRTIVVQYLERNWSQILAEIGHSPQ